MLDFNDPSAVGEAMHALARELELLPRSISGDGLRATLDRLAALVPGMRRIEVPSGSRACDWTVPDEWNVRAAWIERPDGQRICDFAVNRLHLVGYSSPIDARLSRAQLDAHLYSLPLQPEAIPYVTSYYARRWGFCLSERERAALPDGEYRAVIDATLAPGAISIGEAAIPGDSAREVLLSTYCCHPQMANNELSGPVLVAHTGAWLASLPRRRWTYRLLFVPEMIGSLAYLERHRAHLKSHVIAGFQVTCVGDERGWGYLPSRAGTTLADRVAVRALEQHAPGFKRWHWRDRGSDESNWCAPGVDLPVATVTRSKYGSYPEYHTSLDDLDRVVTPKGLGDSFAFYRAMLEALEAATVPRAVALGEPQLGRRGLYSNLSHKGSSVGARALLDVLSLCDGSRDIDALADDLDLSRDAVTALIATLVEHQLVTVDGEPRP